jgi:hypothetical protein
MSAHSRQAVCLIHTAVRNKRIRAAVSSYGWRQPALQSVLPEGAG